MPYGSTHPLMRPDARLRAARNWTRTQRWRCVGKAHGDHRELAATHLITLPSALSATHRSVLVWAVAYAPDICPTSILLNCT